MHQHYIRRFLIAFFVSSGVACTLEEPTAMTHNVDISAADEALYWREVQRRIPAWFRSGGVQPPALPSAKAVYSAVEFLEVPHEFLETCTFNDTTLEIRIGDDKWQSGCVPHELGHATLWLMGNPCWDEFEHPNEDPSHC